MQHMEMRGDFLSKRSVKQTEGQNPIGRKKERRRRRRGGGDKNVSHDQTVFKKKKGINKRGDRNRVTG